MSDFTVAQLRPDERRAVAEAPLCERDCWGKQPHVHHDLGTYSIEVQRLCIVRIAEQEIGSSLGVSDSREAK